MRKAERFGAKFADSIITTLNCVDRLIFKGYLPFGGDKQLNQFVDRLDIRRKDFLLQLEPLAEQLVEHAKSAAAAAEAPTTIFRVSIPRNNSSTRQSESGS